MSFDILKKRAKTPEMVLLGYSLKLKEICRDLSLPLAFLTHKKSG
jgi:hypothetical protein